MGENVKPYKKEGAREILWTGSDPGKPETGSKCLLRPRGGGWSLT